MLRKLDREPRPGRRENLARLAQQGLGFLAGAVALVGAFHVRLAAVAVHGRALCQGRGLFPHARARHVGRNGILEIAGRPGARADGQPVRVRTPADFWKRYNRPAQQFLYEDVFKPLGGLRSPVRAVLATFLINGIIHEYVFDIVVGRVQGYQMAFFLVQGIAVAATFRVRPAGSAVIPWVVGTFAFNLATSVIFFASVGEVLPFYARRATG